MYFIIKLSATASVNGDFVLASSCFDNVLQNCLEKVDDPWHEAFTYLELGIMKIRQKMYMEAKAHFQDALRCKKQYVYREILLRQTRKAMLFLRDTKLINIEWNTNKDVAGEFNKIVPHIVEPDVDVIIGPGEIYEKKYKLKVRKKSHGLGI
jgi:hypothetical protein